VGEKKRVRDMCHTEKRLRAGNRQEFLGGVSGDRQEGGE